MRRTHALLQRLVIAVALAFVLGQAKAATLADCESPFMQDVLNTPMQKSPQNMVYVLWIFDEIQGFGHCYLPEGETNLFADHLERLWLNEIVGDEIPIAKTVRDAMVLEDAIQRKDNRRDYALRKTQQRAFTRSFSAELRRSDDPLPENIQKSPAQYEIRSPNVWISRSQSPNPVTVAIAFTNISPRAIIWPTTTLALKDNSTGQYIAFHCWPLFGGNSAEERGRISPGQRFVTECDVWPRDWPSDKAGLALLENLNIPDNWFLRSEKSDLWIDGPHRYRRAMRELGTKDSSEKARKIIANSTCFDRHSCTRIISELPILRGWQAWLPGLIAGVLSLLGLRLLFGRRYSLRLSWALSAMMLLGTAWGLWTALHSPGMGMGALVLFFLLPAACAGGLFGVWITHFLATIDERKQDHLQRNTLQD